MGFRPQQLSKGKEKQNLQKTNQTERRYMPNTPDPGLAPGVQNVTRQEQENEEGDLSRHTMEGTQADKHTRPGRQPQKRSNLEGTPPQTRARTEWPNRLAGHGLARRHQSHWFRSAHQPRPVTPPTRLALTLTLQRRADQGLPARGRPRRAPGSGVKDKLSTWPPQGPHMGTRQSSHVAHDASSMWQ